MSDKVLVIGLDGGTYSVLEPLAKEGIIPNLARMMETGAKGILRSTVPPISAPAWATFQTGKNPGKHGLFNFFDFADGGFRSSHDFRNSRVVNHASIGSSTVYDYLSQGGKEVISVNIPLTYPVPAVPGQLIGCWLTPPGAKSYTHPPELAAELPDYRIDQDFGEGMYAVTPSGKELDSEYLFDDLFDILEKRADAMVQLLTQKSWDAAMICFTETDRLHHYFWRAINPEYPKYHSDKVTRERERFKALYARLDERIGDLMAAAGDDTNVVIMSDHGFDAPPLKRYNLSHWMMEKGWLVPGGGSSGDGPPTKGGDGSEAAPTTRTSSPWFRMGRVLWQKWVPDAVREQVYAKVGYNPTPTGVDWQRTRAWSFGVNNNLGAVCINETDASGEGCVAKGAELEALTKEIIEGLTTLTDPTTGQLVVQEVYRREEIYDGPYLERFPHVLYLLNPAYEADMESGFVIANERVPKAIPYPNGRGNHRPEGICIATGPDIVPGDKSEYPLASIMPTVLHLVGLPVPEDVDGPVMTDYLSTDRQDVTQGPSKSWNAGDQVEPTAEEVESLQEKLRQLGYM